MAGPLFIPEDLNPCHYREALTVGGYMAADLHLTLGSARVHAELFRPAGLPRGLHVAGPFYRAIFFRHALVLASPLD